MATGPTSKLGRERGADKPNRGPSRPPAAAALATLGPELCGDLDMRIARDGTWFYHGSPIGRKPLVILFSSVLHRDASGDYWLETPAEKARIRVDDAPFTAVEMTVSGEGDRQLLNFRTNVDEWLTAGPGHPIRVRQDVETGEPSPYVLVRDRLEALIVRSVYYELVALGVERRAADGRTMLGVHSGGMFFELGALDDC